MDKLTPTDKKAIGFFTSFWMSTGLDSISSQIMAILFVQTHEVAMEEIANYTGYSLASISNKLNFLEKATIVQRIKKPGSKKVYFFMEKDALEMIKRKMEMNVRLFNLLNNNVDLLIQGYKKEDNSEKIDIIKKYHKDFEFMNEVILKGLEKLNETKTNNKA